MVSAATPALLAACTGASAVLAVVARTQGDAGAPAWRAAWCITGVVAGMAFLRGRLPSLWGRNDGFSKAALWWLFAGVSGAALVGRHALDALLRTAVEVGFSAPLLGRWDLGDLSLLALTLLVAAPVALGGLLRRPRPELLTPALLGLVPLVVVIAAAQLRPVRDGLDFAVAGAFPLVGTMLALAWAPALAGPAALPLQANRRITHHLLPPLVAVATLVALPLWLERSQGGSGLFGPDGVVLDLPAAGHFGLFGDRVGAGLECLASLMAMVIILLLCCRIAARRMPSLRSWVIPVFGGFAVALSAGLSHADLLVLAGVFGWGAVLLGAEPALPEGKT